MKYRLSLVLLLISLTAFSQSLRLMTYNVNGGVGTDSVRNNLRTALTIAAMRPDVVAIQEVDSATTRSGRTCLLDELAEATAMNAYFAPAFSTDGGKTGIGILSKQPADTVMQIPLPGREEPRTLLVAEFPGYLFACTQLSITPADSKAAAIILSSLAEMTEKPLILAGDFNALPDSEPIAILKATYTLLSPADNVGADYIFGANLPDSLAVGDAFIGSDDAASDHRPVIVGLSY